MPIKKVDSGEWAIVIYPNLKDSSKVQEFRKKYDPQFELINPHITLVFPFPDGIKKQKLIKHIFKISKNFHPFNISLEGFERSFDNWLFLLIKEGNEKIRDLHDKLYSGMLKKYLRKKIRYIPHLSLGLFKTNKEYKKAVTEVKKLNLNFNTKIRKIHLIHLNKNRSKIDWSNEFLLNNF